MASLFTLYTSSDSGGPGLLYGNAVGNFLGLLNQCLVSGYSGHAAAGWTKMGSAGSVINDSGNIGIFKQGAGCGYYLYVNDNAPDGGMGDKGANALGYKAMTSLTTAWGVFPMQYQVAAQGSFGGFGFCKSQDASTGRAWKLWADSSTFYLFILDGSGGYGSYMFGDIYSLWGSSDLNRCAFCGSNTDRGTGSIPVFTMGCLDRQFTPLVTGANKYGFYMSDNYKGTFGSTLGYTVGDPAKFNGVMSATLPIAFVGSVPFPNVPDSSYYLSPIWVMDASWNIRGRLRGLWYPCHALANFSDAATFSGSGDLSPKTFTVVKPGWGNGLFCVETSNTVETN